jgi:hypothetical protein
MSDTTVSYTIASSDKGESLVVVGTTVRAITSSNPRYDEIKSYLIANGSTSDFDHVLSLIDAGPEALKQLVKLSERVTYQDGTLFFDNDPVEHQLAQHIVDMVKSGDDNFPAYVAFLENLAANPSKKSRKALFEWISDRNLTITPEGEFVAYKGLTRERKSVHAGGAFVDTGNGPKWVSGQVPNPVGAVVSMARSDVNDNREVGCSTGLHAGTSSYARSFGQLTVIVGINPRDVVMVPKDCNSQKLRVSRYRVLDDNAVDLDETTYGGKHRYDSEVAAQAESFTCSDCNEQTPINQRGEHDSTVCSDCDYYNSDYCSDCQYSYDDCEC